MLHPNVAEAAVVGYPHPVKGEGIYVYATLNEDIIIVIIYYYYIFLGIYIYVTLNEGVHESDELRKALVMQCRSEIGAFAAPDVVHWAPSLPKTRSGKIMRRILRKIAASGKEVTADELGDTSTRAARCGAQRLGGAAAEAALSGPVGSPTRPWWTSSSPRTACEAAATTPPPFITPLAIALHLHTHPRTRCAALRFR